MSQADTASSRSARSGRGSSSAGSDKRSQGFFARIVLFLRQVMDEVRKVVRPTREELTQYTTVVVAFILFVMVFVVLCDQIFQRLVNWVFGGDA